MTGSRLSGTASFCRATRLLRRRGLDARDDSVARRVVPYRLKLPIEREQEGGIVVVQVVVAGKIRKWKGRLLDVDVARLRSELEASRDYLFKAAGVERDLFRG